MNIKEIEQGNAAEQRVQRLKANAKCANDKAKQLKVQADTNAEQLKISQSREKLANLTSLNNN